MRGATATAGIALALVAAPGFAQPTGRDRSNGQIYFDAEFSLRRAEVEADCLGVWQPEALHRAINLRGELRALRRFAQDDSEFDRWEAAFRARDREHLCVSHAAIPSNLRSAREDIRLLRARARRAGGRSNRRGS